MVRLTGANPTLSTAPGPMGEAVVDKAFSHEPALLQETVRLLAVRSGGVYIDATVGEGGHASAVLQAAMPGGRLLGIDKDPEVIQAAGGRLRPYDGAFRLVQGSYAQIHDIAFALGFEDADGILLDLGFSSYHIERSERGFSFAKDEPLDMRFDPEGLLTAAHIVNEYHRDDLADILHRFGEERRSRAIARAVVAARPVEGTLHLSQIVSKVLRVLPGKIHPATRTFQALRIAVNSELDVLESSLEQAVTTLNPGGRLAVISYHSLEDRLVKSTFARESKDCICPPRIPMCICGHTASIRLVNKRVVVPSKTEIQANPRSRSARLRVAERIENSPSS